jgi:hypothetical protein
VTTPDDEIFVDNGARKLSLGELGRTQAGMGRLMPEVGARVWKLWYAAEAGNWRLAKYQLEEAVSLMELGAFVRPKYDKTMARFLADDLGPVKDAVDNADWPAFEAAFAPMVDAANGYHGLYNKGFIRWRLPDHPPPDLDLTPLD